VPPSRSEGPGQCATPLDRELFEVPADFRETTRVWSRPPGLGPLLSWPQRPITWHLRSAAPKWSRFSGLP